MEWGGWEAARLPREWIGWRDPAGRSPRRLAVIPAGKRVASQPPLTLKKRQTDPGYLEFESSRNGSISERKINMRDWGFEAFSNGESLFLRHNGKPPKLDGFHG
ncbi:hypothetical protein DYE48_01925 [Halobacillus trueperi]|uniref:Uncharacterized protein n=1 Tax=Halobacillus trueperi TaxID=156205 RepID=A0A3E0JEH5_9BACI|nr:hypothetical protein DYE48_01925 [Halobacillus trueperi]